MNEHTLAEKDGKVVGLVSFSHPLKCKLMATNKFVPASRKQQRFSLEKRGRNT